MISPLETLSIESLPPLPFLRSQAAPTAAIAESKGKASDTRGEAGGVGGHAGLAWMQPVAETYPNVRGGLRCTFNDGVTSKNRQMWSENRAHTHT